MMTRRTFGTAIAAAGMSPAAAVSSPAGELSGGGLPVDQLHLPAEVYADLKAFAEPVLEQARWLEELPLEGVDPGFAFTPR